MTAITSQANATYHSGQLTARLREWRGLEARTTVVFSRAIDDNPQTGATPRVSGMFDPFAIGYDKGLSDGQVPIRFSGQLVAHTNLQHGPATLRQALTGFRLAATATASSGAPYSYEIFGGTRLSGGYESINGAGGATFLPTVGRNTLRLPARANVDLRLEREVLVREVPVRAVPSRAIPARAVKLTAFAEAFNLLNARNLSRLETRAFPPRHARQRRHPAHLSGRCHRSGRGRQHPGLRHSHILYGQPQPRAPRGPRSQAHVLTPPSLSANSDYRNVPSP